MIRNPISIRLRLILSIAAVLALVLFYTWLSSSRQATARLGVREIAIERLSELQVERTAIATRQQMVLGEPDSEARTTRLAGIATELNQVASELEKFTAMRDDPQKEDRTVPSWSMLYSDGLVRACTPQGAFERKETWIIEDFTATGVRLAVGLLVGTLVSVLAGLLMGCFDPIDAFLLAPFSFFSKVPATAVLPIFFVMIQINFSMYVAIIVFGMLPSLAQAISASVRKDVPEELVFKAYTLGASQVELIWNVIFKQVLPRILDAIRLQIGPAVVLLVAAEWMVAGEGIGYRLRLFYQRTDMTVVFVYVVILGLVGLAVDYGLIWLRRRLCPWFGD